MNVLVPQEGCEGVLYARGSHNVGHSFFIKDGTLHFDYNALGTHYRASGPATLSPGEHRIEARFERQGKGGTITTWIDEKEVGRLELPRIVRMLGSTGTDFGCDRLSTVVDDYEGPFEFTGELKRVTFETRGKPDRRDIETTARSEMAKE